MALLSTITQTEHKARQASHLLWELLREKRQIINNTDLLATIVSQTKDKTINQYLTMQDRLMILHNDLLNLIILFREGAPYKTFADLQERVQEFRQMHLAVKQIYTPVLPHVNQMPTQAA